MEYKIREEGVAQAIKCLELNCKTLVNDSEITRLIKDDNLKITRERLILDNFVKISREFRYCLSENCNYGIYVENGEPRTVICYCGHEFCFGCSRDAHDPINCQMLLDWLMECYGKTEASEIWIKESTKSCPKCSTTYVKTPNVIMVTCSSCKQLSCWYCNKPSTEHNEVECEMSYENQMEERNITMLEIWEPEEFKRRFIKERESYLNDSDSFYQQMKETVEKMIKTEYPGKLSEKQINYIEKSIFEAYKTKRTLTFSYAYAFFYQKRIQHPYRNRSTLVNLINHQIDMSNSLLKLMKILKEITRINNDSKNSLRMTCKHCKKLRIAMLDRVREINEECKTRAEANGQARNLSDNKLPSIKIKSEEKFETNLSHRKSESTSSLMNPRAMKNSQFSQIFGVDDSQKDTDTMDSKRSKSESNI